MLDIMQRVPAEKRHKALRTSKDNYQDIISTHKIRVENGRSCRGCIHYNNCMKNPERIIFLQSIAHSPYCDFTENVIFLKLIENKDEIKKLKKVVKELKQEIANNAEKST